MKASSSLILNTGGLLSRKPGQSAISTTVGFESIFQCGEKREKREKRKEKKVV